jgi:PleD family two-component response regulator
MEVSPQAEERVHPAAERFIAARGMAFDCPPELQGLHVLVVDDDEDARHLIKTVLEQCKAQVTVVPSAACRTDRAAR